MAGDWVKVRCDLHEDPAVINIADRTGLDVDTVVGKLVKLWAWANRQLRSGNAPVTLLFVDRYVGVPSFGEAMVSVQWLDRDAAGHIVFPKFDRHNSHPAKARALATQRVQAHRSRQRCGGNAGVTPPAQQEGYQRREEKSIPPTPPKGGSGAAGSPPATPATGQGLFDPEPLLTFPTVAGQKGGPEQWHLREELMGELRACFPALDILTECRKALAWVTAAAGNRKTARGMKKFLLSWLERAQNSGRGRLPVAPPPSESLEDKMARILREQRETERKDD